MIDRVNGTNLLFKLLSSIMVYTYCLNFVIFNSIGKMVYIYCLNCCPLM